MVQQRCPEWTDHNVSDPGVTLIETFASMVDQLLYRLNRVPDRLYVKFLDLLGVRMFPPTAARADVTFWLSAPQPEPVNVPEGTEIATVRTETEEAILNALCMGSDMTGQGGNFAPGLPLERVAEIMKKYRPAPVTT